jgi:hypothetical protein
MVRTPLPLPQSDAARVTGWGFNLAHLRASFHNRERRQVLLDRLAAFAAILLVLATITMAALYVAHAIPQWRAGQIGGFEIISAPVTLNDVPSAVPTSAAQASTLSRVPLVLVSMLIEMAIFLGLGFYLRHEMDRSP